MIDCPRGEIRDLLPDLVHGRLKAARRSEVERHVASCRACSAEVELLRAMRIALSRPPQLDVTRIAAAVRAAGPVAPAARAVPGPGAIAAGRRRPWADWRAAAGVAAVAIGLTSYAVARMRVADRGVRMPPAQVAVAGHTARPESAGARGEPHGGTLGETVRTGSHERHSTVALSALELGVDGGVHDLADSELRALLESIDQLDGVPSAEPAPIAEPAPALIQGLDEGGDSGLTREGPLE